MWYRSVLTSGVQRSRRLKNSLRFLDLIIYFKRLQIYNCWLTFFTNLSYRVCFVQVPGSDRTSRDHTLETSKAIFPFKLLCLICRSENPDIDNLSLFVSP